MSELKLNNMRFCNPTRVLLRHRSPLAAMSCAAWRPNPTANRIRPLSRHPFSLPDPIRRLLA